MNVSILNEYVREMGLEVESSCLKDLVCFAEELKKWNRKINLTAIIADDDIAIKHLVDSIVVSEWVRDGKRVLDIGSGAGVPAIPLKILLPDARIVSVDSVGKKVTFQRHVIRLLGLKGFEALHARVESLHSSHAGCFDIIISRAFSRMDTFIALAAPLLAEGGQIIAMKGPAAEEEIHEGADLIQSRGFRLDAVHSYVLPRNKGERRLVMLTADKMP